MGYPTVQNPYPEETNYLVPPVVIAATVTNTHNPAKPWRYAIVENLRGAASIFIGESVNIGTSLIYEEVRPGVEKVWEASHNAQALYVFSAAGAANVTYQVRFRVSDSESGVDRFRDINSAGYQAYNAAAAPVIVPGVGA